MNEAHDLSVEIEDITSICDDAARGKLRDLEFSFSANIQKERQISIDEEGDIVDSSKRVANVMMTAAGPVLMHFGNADRSCKDGGRSKDRTFKNEMSEEECLIFFSIILERKKKEFDKLSNIINKAKITL